MPFVSTSCSSKRRQEPSRCPRFFRARLSVTLRPCAKRVSREPSLLTRPPSPPRPRASEVSTELGFTLSMMVAMVCLSTHHGVPCCSTVSRSRVRFHDPRATGAVIRSTSRICWPAHRFPNIVRCQGRLQQACRARRLHPRHVVSCRERQDYEESVEIAVYSLLGYSGWQCIAMKFL